MTESEWLVCTDPQPMLEFVRANASDLELRLFACGCCRSIWRLLKEKHIVRKTLEFAERFADGQATKNELSIHAWGKPGEFSGIVMRKAWDAAEYSADHASGLAEQAVRMLDQEAHQAWDSVFGGAWKEHRLGEAIQVADAAMPTEWIEKARAARKEEQRKQSALLREIFGYPLRPPTINSAVLNDAVVTLARGIYDERTFDWLPELADALEQAGCDTAELIAHCRGPGPHVRGCWVLDLLLGKG